MPSIPCLPENIPPPSRRNSFSEAPHVTPITASNHKPVLLSTPRNRTATTKATTSSFVPFSTSSDHGGRTSSEQNPVSSNLIPQHPRLTLNKLSSGAVGRHSIDIVRRSFPFRPITPHCTALSPSRKPNPTLNLTSSIATPRTPRFATRTRASRGAASFRRTFDPRRPPPARDGYPLFNRKT